MVARILSLLLLLNISGWANAQSIVASISYKQFMYEDQVLVETYLKIPSSSLKYKAVEGGYQAEVNASYFFEDSQSNTIYCGNKLKIVSPIETDLNVSKDILFMDQCLINSGDFNFYIELQDGISQTSGGGLISLVVASLDEEPVRGPIMHINLESKAPWYEVTDGLPQHQTLPPGVKQAFRAKERS